MKRKIILSLITICILSFASCGNNTTETSETTVTAETTVEATPEPTATPEPAFTPEAETTPEATESKSEINENDSQFSEGAVDEDNVEPEQSTASTEEDVAFLTDQVKQDLKTLGATDSEINNIKSEKDMVDLVNKLITSGGTSNSGSTSSSSTGETSENESDPWGDVPATPLGSGDTVQGSM